jgi:hypothetical protein
MMMRAIWLSLALVLAATPALAEERDHPAKLMLLMRLIDQVPTKAQLLEAGAGEHGGALVAIARDTALQRYPRMRAAGALGMFKEAKLALAAIVEQGDDVEVKIQALSALVHVEGAEARSRLNRLKLHAHPDLRAAALRQLSTLDSRLSTTKD